MVYNIVQFKPFTSREDFIIVGSVFDQDTGTGINLAGVTGNGTSALWAVNAGAAITTSNTSVTVPNYPIGNQLSALSITVGLGLNINAGDPITMVSTIPALTLNGYVLSYSKTTGILTAQIGMTFEFEIRRKAPHLQGPSGGGGYVPFFDVGVGSDFGPLITASLGSGILITDVGFYQIRIPESTFRRLQGPRTYSAALTLTDSQDTRGVFLGDLPVLFGGVTQ